ncbi:hypothetical protein VTK56DRAFT_1274 [Thermocarpiscus australiensis]
MLTGLPVELLHLICKHLYQADLYHLGLTCRILAKVTEPLLYKRDITDFDCLALRYACAFGVIPTLQRTLNYGAPANHVFHRQSHVRCGWIITTVSDVWVCYTPIKTAIVANEAEAVRVLCEHGADVNGGPSTTYVAMNTGFDTFRPINFAMGTPDMPARRSFQHGNPQIIRYLLDAGADPNQSALPWYSYPPEDRPAMTPLLMAMQARVPAETVKLLLERGADPTQPAFYMSRSGNHADCSPLGLALVLSDSGVWALNWEKVRLLLAYGGVREVSYLHFRRQISPSYPMPVLYRHWDHPQIVRLAKLFIDEGADLADWSKYGIPAILAVIWRAEDRIEQIDAARRHNRETEEHARATGSSSHETETHARATEANLKASSAIIKRDAAEIVHYMVNATSMVESARSVRRSTIIDDAPSSTIKELPKAKQDQTALRYVCGPFRSNGAADLISMFLRYGADITSSDPRGLTALHHAAMFSSGDRMRILVAFLRGQAAQLAVNAQDAGGWTPLHYACLFSFWRPDELSGQVKTARLLLASGADVRARTASGWTPLSLSVLSGNPEMVQLLLDHGADADDLLLSPGRREQIAPTDAAAIGKLVFRHRDQDGQSPRRPVSDLATELAAAKAQITDLLEKLIPSPVATTTTAPVAQEEERRPSHPATPTAAAADQPPPAPVDTTQRAPDPANDAYLSPLFKAWWTEQPFGRSFLSTDQFTTEHLERSLKGLLLTLERRGMDGWVVDIGVRTASMGHVFCVWSARPRR